MILNQMIVTPKNGRRQLALVACDKHGHMITHKVGKSTFVRTYERNGRCVDEIEVNAQPSLQVPGKANK